MFQTCNFLTRWSGSLRSISRVKEARRNVQRGFTVLEVAVVMLVFAIIAAIAIPAVLEYLKLYRLGVASRNIGTTIQRARYLATSNNTRAGIVIREANRLVIEQYDVQGSTPPQE